ncbi:HEAT repeat domain-containing protein [Myxococcus sp. RHSTA-1-4]|uniref:HEAT repeat domain-containing protein n=1 Tax=Myxococcus sp. RHSTA-1-4 TaxID=2874601 RepID=UPI001CBD7113|nr:HEAT repeat domain-containing protein [Myxococcus sp. RHSTA-1-4]MBZ4417985.1 HEAT repeat domain-containing protein [Myxococcus sp. RHSTA-1-4]
MGSLSRHPGAEDFLRELGEVHLSELEFLLAQRLRHLRNPEVPWPRVGLLEARALAHAEALHAGGAGSLVLARAALAEEDADRVRAGAYALALHGPVGLEEAVHSLSQAPEEWLPAHFEALALVPPPRVAPALMALLDSPRPVVRASAAQALGWSREGEATRLLPLLNDAMVPVREAAALALARLRYTPALPLLESLSLRVPPDEAAGLLRAALLLGSSSALEWARHLCATSCPPPSSLVELLALAGDERDVTRLQRWLVSPTLTAPALRALGILGVPSTVPLLLEYLESADAAPAAAQALALMTGAPLLREERLRGELDEEGEEPSGPRVTLPLTDPEPWRQWWKEHQVRFRQAIRWRHGQPFSTALCLAELKDSRSPLDVRTRAASELALHSRRSFGFEPDWPVARQKQALLSAHPELMG